MSRALLATGVASVVGSLGLWISGRLTGDLKRQTDGLFVGLWAPSFFILADRLAVANLDRVERRRFMGLDEDETLHVEGELKVEPEEELVQSPRPLSHVQRQ
jgi:hypothetical protein